jgi:hypothetical protein
MRRHCLPPTKYKTGCKTNKIGKEDVMYKILVIDMLGGTIMSPLESGYGRNRPDSLEAEA